MQDGLPQLLLQKLLLPLTELLLPLSGNNKDAAWDNAIDATTSFEPRTPHEFRLAARIAILNIRANQIAAQSADPCLPPAVAIRMSQCALSYMREGDKAERRLEKLQTEALEVTQVHLTSIAPPAEQPAAPVEETMAQTEQPAVRAEESESQTEQPAVQAEAPVPPKTNIPAYKLLKQARRQQKQLDRDARMQAKAQSPALPPDLSIAA